MVTVAPATTAPLGSVTVPVIVPEVAPAWAYEEMGRIAKIPRKRKIAATRRHVRIDDLRWMWNVPGVNCCFRRKQPGRAEVDWPASEQSVGEEQEQTVHA